MVQINHKYKTLDKQKLVELQNKQREKYGLRPHKRLDAEFLYLQQDAELQRSIPSEYDGGMYQ